MHGEVAKYHLYFVTPKHIKEFGNYHELVNIYLFERIICIKRHCTILLKELRNTGATYLHYQNRKFSLLLSNLSSCT